LAFEYFQHLQYTSALGLILKPRKKKLYPSLHSNLFTYMKKKGTPVALFVCMLAQH